LLNDAIDRIAGPEASPSVEAVASSMTAGEVREAAIIHLSALLEGEPEGVTDQEFQVNGLTLRLAPTDDAGATIRYADVSKGFAVQGASLTRDDGPTSLAALLKIYLYARDRSDTLLYLPAPMRSERIADLAQATGASERFVRYLLARYRNLSERAAA